jgi:hypothetical protein
MTFNIKGEIRKIEQNLQSNSPLTWPWIYNKKRSNPFILLGFYKEARAGFLHLHFKLSS